MPFLGNVLSAVLQRVRFMIALVTTAGIVPTTMMKMQVMTGTMTYFSVCCRSGDERTMSSDSISESNAIEIITAHQNVELSPHSHADLEP